MVNGQVLLSRVPGAGNGSDIRRVGEAPSTEEGSHRSPGISSARISGLEGDPVQSVGQATGGEQ